MPKPFESRTTDLKNRKTGRLCKEARNAMGKPSRLVFSVDFEGMFCYGMNAFRDA
jgi:hypothetical protein